MLRITDELCCHCCTPAPLHPCCDKWYFSVSDKEPIDPTGFPAPFAPITLDIFTELFMYMLISSFGVPVYDGTCILGDNKVIFKLNWIELGFDRNVVSARTRTRTEISLVPVLSLQKSQDVTPICQKVQGWLPSQNWLLWLSLIPNMFSRMKWAYT